MFSFHVGWLQEFIFLKFLGYHMCTINFTTQLLSPYPLILHLKKSHQNCMCSRHLIVNRLRQYYENALLKFLKRKYTVVLSFIIVFFGTIFYAIGFMNFVLFPESSAVRFFIRTGRLQLVHL